MLEIYECLDCEKYFHELDEKQICYEDLYGVDTHAGAYTYDNVACCPHCGGTDYKEVKNSEEICEALNEWWKWKQEKRKENSLAHIRIKQALDGK